MRKIFSLTLLLPLLLSCGHGGYRATLSHVDSLLRTDPATALAITDSIMQDSTRLSRAEQMRTRLYRGVARIRTYNPVTNDSTATAIARYYDSHGTPNDRMMAYYLLGCTYRDLGDTPMQLECLQKAAEVADTTRNDCDYYTMVSIYGHMANLYHKQVLPEEELKALKVLGECAKKDNDTISFLQSFELQMRAYTLSKEIDKVLCIADSARKNYKYLGYDNMAATLLITPISLYLDRADYKKAKEYLDIYERESGLFDKNGNIEKGREYHYFNKGRYLLGVEKTDSAIFYFHRALNGGKKEEAYYGLLTAYEKKNIPDSISKYAKLFASTNDSAWFAKNSQTVAQMTAMYDYSRHKKQAEEATSKYIKERKKILILISLLLLALSIIAFALFIIRKHRIAEEKKERQTQKEYDDAILAIHHAQNDLRLLKYEYDEVVTGKIEKEQQKKESPDICTGNIIIEKDNTKSIGSEIASLHENYLRKIEEKDKELKTLIEEKERLQKNVTFSRSVESDARFMDSAIYSKFCHSCFPQKGQHALTDNDWEQFMSLFRECYPTYYAFISHNNVLRQTQIRVCALIRAGFCPGDKCLILDVNSSKINKLKIQINKKLFGKDDAKSLKNNLTAYFY
ncbi:MAG: hypothetical protein IJL45_08785 [Prevotella sp.]|nr:hypothetical protein [Prevotella sp.]